MYNTLYQYTQLVDLFGNKYFLHLGHCFTTQRKQNIRFLCLPMTLHLLKLVRNHFIDTGFTINNGHITTRTIVDLLNDTYNCVWSWYAYYIYFPKPKYTFILLARQKVILAAQTFFKHNDQSHQTLPFTRAKHYQPIDTAEFVEQVSNWISIRILKPLIARERYSIIPPIQY